MRASFATAMLFPKAYMICAALVASSCLMSPTLQAPLVAM